MPDSGEIDRGDAERAEDDQQARDHLQQFIVELLRALARGNDAWPVTSTLVDTLKHIKKASTPLAVLMDEVVSESHRRIASESDEMDYATPMKSILKSSLQVMAESLCQDPAARGRRGRRMNDLRGHIENLVHERAASLKPRSQLCVKISAQRP